MKNGLMILLCLSLWTNSTNAATVLRKGESAPFDGALLPEEEMRDVLKDGSFRLIVEPALMLPREENPENLECAGMGVILGLLGGLAVDSDNRSNQVVLFSSSVLVAIYTLQTCL
jgi:hypothetical protein